MDADRSPSPQRLTARRAIVQLIGFAAGLALFVWVVAEAIRTGDWNRLREANPWLVAALLGTTAVSLVINGATFWVSVRPLRPLRFVDMQRLNMAASLLNYAPLRLGAIGRVVYHLKVDRLSLLEVGAWFGMLGYVLLLAVAACVMATLLWGTIDWIWGLIVIGQTIFGALLTRLLVSHPLIVRHGRGIDRLLSEPISLWGSCALRLADIVAFAARMAVALAILGIELPLPDTVILALVALIASLIPFGRLGFREFCVSAAASRLSTEVDVPWEQLALVESAGEMLIFIPAGLIALPWFLRRLRGGSAEPALQPDDEITG